MFILQKILLKKQCRYNLSKKCRYRFICTVANVHLLCRSFFIFFFLGGGLLSPSFHSLIFIYIFFLICILMSIHLCFLFPSWFPETLAMKGLTLNCMDRKTEAYELVRQGLKVGGCCLRLFSH